MRRRSGRQMSEGKKMRVNLPVGSISTTVREWMSYKGLDNEAFTVMGNGASLSPGDELVAGQKVVVKRISYAVLEVKKKPKKKRAVPSDATDPVQIQMKAPEEISEDRLLAGEDDHEYIDEVVRVEFQESGIGVMTVADWLSERGQSSATHLVIRGGTVLLNADKLSLFSQVVVKPRKNQMIEKE